MKSIGGIIIALSLFSGAAFSQGGGVSLMMGYPQNGFKENVSSTSYGGSLYFTFWNPINYGATEDVFFDDDIMYNMVSYHLIFQIFPKRFVRSGFRPYFEALAGGSSIFANDVDAYDWMWNFGGGAGLMVKLPSRNFNWNYSETWLDLKIRFIHGSRVEYMCESSADIYNGTFYPVESDVDYIAFNIGFTTYFN